VHGSQRLAMKGGAGSGGGGQAAGRAPLREELFWQLANARLLLGDAGGAREALGRVIEIAGRRAEDARRLLEKIRP